MLDRHPDILSLSEIFMAINTRAFVHDVLDGPKFWEKLSRPSKAMSRILTPETCPKEFKFDFSKSTRFTQETLPPILFMALPRLSDDPETLFAELELALCDRPKAPLAEHFLFMFEWLCGHLDKKLWVERSGGSLMYVENLIRHFPEAKFVHLYRDGREVALSMQAYPPLRLLAQSWHSTKKLGIDLLKPPFRIGDSKAIYFAQDYLTPLHGIERRLKQSVDVDVLGEFWSEMVLTGKEAMDELPDSRIFHLAYEDMMAAPRDRLSELITFIAPGLDHEAWLEQAVPMIKPTNGRRDSLSDTMRQKINDACGPGLYQLGYPIGTYAWF